MQLSGLGVLTVGLFSVDLVHADPAPEITPISAQRVLQDDYSSSTGFVPTSSTGASVYRPRPVPAVPVYRDDPPPAASRPHPIYYPPEPPRRTVTTYERSGDATEAAMLVACSLERRPYGSPFVDGRVASNWRWSEVRRDPRREIEFSQRRHGSAPFESPMCELFMLKRMLEQGGNSSLIYRCELVRDELYRSYAHIQSGGSTGAASFGLLDSIMGSRSSENNERICRNPSTDELFACATEDLNSHLGNTAKQRQAAEQVMNLCRSRGANMNSAASYFNAGIIPGGNFCGQMGGGGFGGGGGVAVIQSHEPWYKTVLSAGLGALKVLGPLKVLNDGHKRREQTSQLAINRNADLGFPSVVQGAGAWGGGGGIGGHGCMGYGTCGGNAGIMLGGNNGGFYPGVGGGFSIGASGGWGMGGGAGTCGVPPYAPWAQGCGFNGGGFMGGVGGGVNGLGLGGFGGVAGYPGLHGYPGFGTGGFGNPGFGNQWGAGQNSGLPGPFGTLGGTNGWSPANGGNFGNQWGAGGQFGGPSYWGTNPHNGFAGANNGHFIDTFQAQQARAINRNNRYSSLYDKEAEDAQQNAGAMWGTANSYSPGYSNGYNYYPPYPSIPYR
jgi:hypothetical protein